MRRRSTRARRATFLPPPPLRCLFTSLAPSPAVQHIVNTSHTFPPCHPRAQLKHARNTRHCSAAGHVTLTRNIGVRVYCCSCACDRCGGRRCGARRQRQRAATAPRLRPCHACRLLQTRYLRFWRHKLHLQFSRASGANGLQRLRGCRARRAERRSGAYAVGRQRRAESAGESCHENV